MSVQQKYQISNLYNQIQRLKEEEKLLLQEMAQYIHYFKETLPKKLQGDIAGMKTTVCECTTCILPSHLSRAPFVTRYC